MSAWAEIRSEFETDGSLRDIYIFETSFSEWDILLSKLAASRYTLEYVHGEKKVELPSSLEIIKLQQLTGPTTLRIYLSLGIQVNCHFFCESQMEFDITPLEVNSAEKYSELISFMQFLREALNKKVVLTHENSHDMVISSV